MPRYDYFCPANQITLEVEHRMSESVRTWAELCYRLNLPLGDTPGDAPVEKIIPLPIILGREGSELADVPCRDAACLLRGAAHSHRGRVDKGGKELI